MGLQGWQWAIIALIILLLFGAPKLPKLARSVGESMRIFKSEVKTMRDDGGNEGTDASDPTAVEGRVVDPTAPEGSHDPRRDHQT
ncbi:Sec-independent protein translocase subunit TatA [Nesterenkonia alba]|uniref:Sec-independent protein translocase subunit TatA n=1 Tax=Nesterenkonia alba TaxID=515814 RepID=UPI0003B39D55|nr:Sec-independent protein translocase subunit TatA [Nesterenkonia alba]